MVSKVFKKNGDEILTTKAYNGRVILSWLHHCLLEVVQANPNHELLILTSTAMNLDL